MDETIVPFVQGAEPGFWRHEPPKPQPCWVCGEETPWIYLDLGYQHYDCDRFPAGDGEHIVVRGVERVKPWPPRGEEE